MGTRTEVINGDGEVVDSVQKQGKTLGAADAWGRGWAAATRTVESGGESRGKIGSTTSNSSRRRCSSGPTARCPSPSSAGTGKMDVTHAVRPYGPQAPPGRPLPGATWRPPRLRRATSGARTPARQGQAARLATKPEERAVVPTGVAPARPRARGGARAPTASLRPGGTRGRRPRPSPKIAARRRRPTARLDLSR